MQPTAVATPSRTVPPSCVGDCNGNGSVNIDELIILVNIALGGASAATCAAGDADQNGLVIVSELVSAVRRALYGCAAAQLEPYTYSAERCTYPHAV